MTDESLILSSIGTGRNGARCVGSMLGYKAVPHGNFPDAVLPVEISFTRASTGMEFVNGLWQSAAINMPRRYNDSYLNEPAAQNRWLMSSCFGAVPYGGSITNAGESTIFKDVDESIYTEGVGSGLNGFYDSIAVISGTTYTLSCFIKYNAGTQRFGRLAFGANFPEGGGATIDLTTGALSTPPSGITATSLNAGNGWWRISITQTANGTGNSNITIALAETSGGSILYTGNGSSVKVQGGQFETGSVATSPIITAGSAVTRAADAPLASNFGNVIPQTEGGFFLDFEMPSIVGSGVLAELANISSQNLNFQYSGSTLYWYSNAGAFSCQTTIAANTRYKVLGLYKTNAVQFWVNGVLVESDLTSSVHASLSKFSLGCSTTPANNVNIKIYESQLTPYLDAVAAAALTTL